MSRRQCGDGLISDCPSQVLAQDGPGVWVYTYIFWERRGTLWNHVWIFLAIPRAPICDAIFSVA